MHYWLTGTPEVKNATTAVLDFGAAITGLLIAGMVRACWATTSWFGLVDLTERNHAGSVVIHEREARRRRHHRWRAAT
jgi:hypothetical protein